MWVYPADWCGWIPFKSKWYYSDLHAYGKNVVPSISSFILHNILVHLRRREKRVFAEAAFFCGPYLLRVESMLWGIYPGHHAQDERKLAPSCIGFRG